MVGEEEADQRRLGGAFFNDLQTRGVSWSEVEVTAADRVRWRNLPIVPRGPGELSVLSAMFN